MNKIISRVIAIVLSLAVFASTPAIVQASSQNGRSSSGEQYVEGLYITYANSSGGKSAYEVACANFEKMLGKDVAYEVVAYDLNKDADALASSKQGVFLAYTTTENRNEAIRDIAAMNMNGGYTFTDYETVIQQKYKDYKQMGVDEATLIEGYREMYNSGSQFAEFAYEQLNKFIEDDSKMTFGDYLLTCDLTYTEAERAAREENREISVDPIVMLISQMTNAMLFQVNSILLIATTSDAKSTIFDKMSALDSSAIEAAKEDASLYDDALAALSQIKEMIANMEAVKEKITENAESEEPLDADDLLSADEAAALALATLLATTEYNGSNLYDTFASSDLSVKDLYPLISVLSEAQKAGIRFVGIDLFFQTEMSAKNEDAKKILNEGVANVEAAIAESVNETLEFITEETKKTEDDPEEDVDWGEDDVTDPISIYIGVDRTLLNKTLAITTDAQRAEQSHKGYTILGGKTLKEVRIVLFAAFVATAITCAVAGLTYAHYINKFNELRKTASIFVLDAPKGITEFLPWNAAKGFETIEKMQLAKESHILLDFGYKGEEMHIARQSVYYAGVAGTVMWIAAGVAMIVAGAYGIAELYAYYHPSKSDFAPRPEGILDVKTTNEDEPETVMYSGVYDTNGEIGDINGWVAKNWVALYTTKDPDAGNPILADEIFGSKPVSDSNKRYVHLFGQSDAMSFNDYAYRTGNKIYLGFTVEKEMNNTAVASIFSGNNAVVSVGILSGLGGVVIGALIVIFITNGSRRKKVAEEE